MWTLTIQRYICIESVLYLEPAFKGMSNVLTSGHDVVIYKVQVEESCKRVTKKSQNILSSSIILCWATFLGILDDMWPASSRLDTPESRPLLL